MKPKTNRWSKWKLRYCRNESRYTCRSYCRPRSSALIHTHRQWNSWSPTQEHSAVTHNSTKPEDSWVKRDQLDATCFIITLFSAQHVSDVNTSILRSLRLIRWVTSRIVSGSMCVGVTLWFGYGYHTTPPQPNHNVTPTHIEQDTTHEITQRISRKLLRMDVLTSETCWALNKVIIKQVASSWSLFTQLPKWCTFQ